MFLFFFHYVFTLCSFIVFFYCFCMLSTRDNRSFKKRRGRINLKINLKMHHTQVSFRLKNTKSIKYAVELNEFSWCYYIMFYGRHSVIWVWLNSKTFPHASFLTHAKVSTHATHAKILWAHATDTKISTDATYVTHAKVLWTYNTHATHEKIWPTPPTHLRYYATHATHKPTPPTLFSRLW